MSRAVGPRQRKRHQAYCFTINNWTPADRDLVEALPLHGATYFVCGLEVAPDTGTPHFQGYVHFENPRDYGGVAKLLPRAHLEGARGSARDNDTYCRKGVAGGGECFSWGDLPQDPKDQGVKEQARWKEIREMAITGKLEEIDPKVYVCHYSSLKRIAADHMVRPPDLETVCGRWFWGPAGTGKTTTARATYPEAYIKSRDKWWDGYQGEEVVILDDLDKYHVALAGLLKDWGDKWTFKAEIKGGYLWIRPQVFVVTTQYAIDTIWSDEETQDALKRRFVVEHFNKEL